MPLLSIVYERKLVFNFVFVHYIQGCTNPGRRVAQATIFHFFFFRDRNLWQLYAPSG